MKFICNACVGQGEPCILDVGNDNSVTLDSLRCVLTDDHYCDWQKYDDSKVANLQPEVATLPKLTAEVFDRPDCPKWAKIAVVNRNGKAYYGGYKDARINCSGGWCGLYEEQGKWERIGNDLFDASDWQNSLIERPAKLPDWCKVGEWVYLSNAKYYKIEKVDSYGIILAGGIVIKTDDIHAEAVSARLRPYNAEEMKGMGGEDEVR